MKNTTDSNKKFPRYWDGKSAKMHLPDHDANLIAGYEHWFADGGFVSFDKKIQDMYFDEFRAYGPSELLDNGDGVPNEFKTVLFNRYFRMEGYFPEDSAEDFRRFYHEYY